ncbi:hypothetical protein CEXT_550001 [Caerostris extrusa]|uniref:Uncharacterized protein n=1 Tax=Caerostris extrusa TaxID=172846 RepID=A0AAV4X5A7_CAEEX|nr:hypothetical protein CEXT_550001 [Caerostris extrusa]
MLEINSRLVSYLFSPVREFRQPIQHRFLLVTFFFCFFSCKERIRVNPISLVYTHKRHLTALEKKIAGCKSVCLAVGGLFIRSSRRENGNQILSLTNGPGMGFLFGMQKVTEEYIGCTAVELVIQEAATSTSPSGFGTPPFLTNFAEILRVSPPPVPPSLLRSVGRKENFSIGKVSCVVCFLLISFNVFSHVIEDL